MEEYTSVGEPDLAREGRGGEWRAVQPPAFALKRFCGFVWAFVGAESNGKFFGEDKGNQFCTP